MSLFTADDHPHFPGGNARASLKQEVAGQEIRVVVDTSQAETPGPH